MRLGFHYHVPAHRLPSGEIVTSGPLGRFLDALASRCEELVCFLHSPRQDEIPYLDHVLQATNLRWISAGKHRSVPWRTAWSHRITRPLAEGRGQLDGVLLRGPSPLLPAFARAARPLPTTLLLVGDYLAGVDDLPQPRWRKELIRKWARWNAARQRDVARTSLTLVNSSDLYETFRGCSPLLRQVRTSTLNESDFRWRDDSCGEQPVHLLYSGRMDRGKGLLVMVAAVGLLVRRGFNVVLDLVGPPQPGDPVLDEVASSARAWRVEQRVVYHGFRVLGEDLFRHYRKADIYLSASLATEGFPRSIWEAMAHSVPVVASRVGSIPALLEDGVSARLVRPRSAEDLAAGLQDILRDQRLRTTLIANGFALARANTLEQSTGLIFETIKDWILHQPRAPVRPQATRRLAGPDGGLRPSVPGSDS